MDQQVNEQTCLAIGLSTVSPLASPDEREYDARA